MYFTDRFPNIFHLDQNSNYPHYCTRPKVLIGFQLIWHLWILVPTHSPTKWTIIWSFLLLSPFGKLFSLSVIISRFVGVEDLQRYHFTKFGCGGIGGRRDNISLSFPLLHKLSTVIIHFILYLIIEYDYILCIFGSNSLFCSLECSKCS